MIVKLLFALSVPNSRTTTGKLEDLFLYSTNVQSFPKTRHGIEAREHKNNWFFLSLTVILFQAGQTAPSDPLSSPFRSRIS